eukprot:30791-Eustigmatos_ZCMA.PRE.1
MATVVKGNTPLLSMLLEHNARPDRAFVDGDPMRKALAEAERNFNKDLARTLGVFKPGAAVGQTTPL